MPRPIREPSGPATGRNAVPGIMNAPHPTAQPKERATAPHVVRYGFNPPDAVTEECLFIIALRTINSTQKISIYYTTF
jgi:hypothetical protein